MRLRRPPLPSTSPSKEHPKPRDDEVFSHLHRLIALGSRVFLPKGREYYDWAADPEPFDNDLDMRPGWISPPKEYL